MKIRLTSVYVDERIKARGADFAMPPTAVPGATIAQVNDTCGNLVQISEIARW